MEKFLVFGNPIHHSKSTYIHDIFTVQTGLEHTYGTRLTQINIFERIVQYFFYAGGQGANVTVPFKEQAYHISDKISNRAEREGAINTIKFLYDGIILGDNTDGIGFLMDLKRNNMIKKNNYILLVGAGGAARGVIFPLLSFGCSVMITNRTFKNAKKLVKNFHVCKTLKIIPIDKCKKPIFHVIINATTSGIFGIVPSFAQSVIDSQTSCYDMFYKNGCTPFLYFAKRKGSIKVIDGFGMLIKQASNSFFMWHGICPKVEKIFRKLGCI